MPRSDGTINVFVETAWDQYLADVTGTPDRPPECVYCQSLLHGRICSDYVGFLWYCTVRIVLNGSD
jgi:hypothetical protein